MKPQLYFLGVEARNFEAAILLHHGRVGDNLGQFLLENINVAENLPHNSDLSLATSSCVCVNGKVTFM